MSKQVSLLLAAVERSAAGMEHGLCVGSDAACQPAMVQLLVLTPIILTKVYSDVRLCCDGCCLELCGVTCPVHSWAQACLRSSPLPHHTSEC